MGRYASPLLVFNGSDMKTALNISRTEVHGKASISASRKETVDAGIAMLELGGNAVDAAISAALVAGVIEPMETTLAGSGFMLLAKPDGEVLSIEFAPRAPLQAHENMFEIDPDQSGDRGLGISKVIGDANLEGASSAGVPATLKGLVDAQAKFGKLPLKTVMEPAINMAANGFYADNYFVLESLDNLAALRKNAYASKLFLDNGLPPKPTHLGSATLGKAKLVKQEQLANTLSEIANKGVDYFYKGPLGKLFTKTHADLGGYVTEQDLAAVKTNITAPRKLKFKDAYVWAPTAPCGAVTQLQILNILQSLYKKSSSIRDDPEYAVNLIQASWYAFADRYHWLGDPEFITAADDFLLSDKYAAYIADLINSNKTNPFQGTHTEMPWGYFAKNAANNPWAVCTGDAKSAPVWNPESASESTSGTAHISITDADGMAVSITHTAANHFGSKVVCEHTGLLLDAAMGWFNALPNAANSIKGGKRPLANMAPMIITKGDQYKAALGAPGGRRIICATVQIALDLIEEKTPVDLALLEPRLDASGWDVLLSERLSKLEPELRDKGINTKIVNEQHEGFGYEMARPILATLSNGVTYASADPFSKGFARSIM